MKSIAIVIFTALLTSFAHADVTTNIQHLQKRWAEIKYQLPEKQQEKAYEELVKQAEGVVAENPGSADALVWEGIIRSTYAGARGGLGALGEAKKARQSFEHAIEIDPGAMNGSAYTSLGSLYYQVPRWPLGFGNSKKAQEMLEKGLEFNPDGIDSNFFYGDFLMSKKEYEPALAAFEKALQAPPRPNRQLADQGRRQEIEAAIQQVKKKLDKNHNI